MVADAAVLASVTHQGTVAVEQMVMAAFGTNH